MRVLVLHTGYHAPLDVYNHLHAGEVQSIVQPVSEVNLCVGKEWYRFPSSFYLPSKKWKLRFIRSQFKGQLPKPYSSFPNATSIIPEDMNDMNREEPSRYVSAAHCCLPALIYTASLLSV